MASSPVLPEKLLHAAPVLCSRVSCTTPGSSGADCPISRWAVTHHFNSWSPATQAASSNTYHIGHPPCLFEIPPHHIPFARGLQLLFRGFLVLRIAAWYNIIFKYRPVSTSGQGGPTWTENRY